MSGFKESCKKQKAKASHNKNNYKHALKSCYEY